MGSDYEQDGRDVTASIDQRGRLTIKEDDRKALGINGDKALLDLTVTVLEIESEGGEDDD